MPTVNNVTRMLDTKKVKYIAYETPAEKLGAVETANYLNVPIGKVFKTVVVVPSRDGGSGSSSRKKPVLALVPGDHVVDLKLVAMVLGEKKFQLPTEKEAEQITGLQAGGISPLALINKGFTVVLDETAKTFDAIHISGGQRGLNILIPVSDLIELTHARYGKISIPG